MSIEFLATGSGGWCLRLLLQSTVLLAISWGVATLFSRRHPAGRHAVWLTALVALLALAPANWLASRCKLALFTSTAVVREAKTLPPLPLPAGPAGPAAVLAPQSPAAPASSTLMDYGTVTEQVLLALWAAGSLLQALRLGLGLLRMRRLRRSCRPLQNERLARLLDQVCLVLGRQGAAADLVVLESPEVGGPVALGFWHPVIVLPAGLIDRLGESQLRDVLLHEGAHWVRRDSLVGLLQRLAGVLFWPQPLLAVLQRELGRAREECCDNHVMSVSRRTEYARLLLGLAESLGQTQPLPGLISMLNPRWNLSRRIHDLLDERRNAMTRVSRWVGWTALVGGVAVVATLVACRAEQANPTERESAPNANTPPELAFPHGYFGAPGLVEVASGQSGELGFEVSGTLKAVFVGEGDVLKQGDKLAELENTQQAAQLASARAQLASAKAQLLETTSGQGGAWDGEIGRAESAVRRFQAVYDMLLKGVREEVLLQAQADFEGALAREDQTRMRAERLESSASSNPGAVSPITLNDAKQEHQISISARVRAELRLKELKNGARQEEKDLAKADLEAAQIELKRLSAGRSPRISVAQAAVELAEANLLLAQAALDKTVLRSPLAGTVVYRYKNPGEAVIAFQNDPVVLIANTNDLRVRVEVDEADYAKAFSGQRVKVAVDGFENRYFDGVVEKSSVRTGQKKFSTGSAREKLDVKVVEVLVRFLEKPPLLLGLRVSAYFEGKAGGK